MRHRRPRVAVPFVLASVLALPLAAQTPTAKLFDAPVIVPGLLAEMELLGDLDNDGDVDVVGFQFSGGTAWTTMLQPLVNGGSGNLTVGTPVPMPTDTGHHTALADVDGDGVRDVLATTGPTHPAGTGVLVFRGLGAATFAAPVHAPIPGSVLQLGTGNCNGDGVADVFVTHLATGGLQARWLLGGPGLALPAAQGALLAGLQPSGGNAMLDADGDGVTDFAVLTPAGAGIDVAVFRTTPAGFTPYATLPLSPGFTNLLVAADVDGDGDDDLLGAPITGVSAFDVVTFRNQGAVGFVSSSQAIAGPAVNRLTVVDQDGDGDGDLVARTGGTSPTNPVHDLTLFENAGGVFTPRRVDSVPGATTRVGAGAADLDGDGRSDYVDSRAVLFGTGTTVPAPRPYTAFPYDWDGDGDLDDVMRGELLVHDGRGGFTVVPGFWPPPPAPNQHHGDPVAIADFDGDGFRELVVPLVFQPFPTS
jgi:hypothetical protein